MTLNAYENTLLNMDIRINDYNYRSIYMSVISNEWQISTHIAYWKLVQLNATLFILFDHPLLHD